MIKYLLITALTLLLFSCGTPKPLYNWQNYDAVVYNYIKVSDEKSTENLLKTYDKLIKKYGTRKVPAPGVYADYGYLLIKGGEIEKGKTLLQKEISLYPESATLINGILKRLEK